MKATLKKAAAAVAEAVSSPLAEKIARAESTIVDTIAEFDAAKAERDKAARLAFESPEDDRLASARDKAQAAVVDVEQRLEGLEGVRRSLLQEKAQTDQKAAADSRKKQAEEARQDVARWRADAEALEKAASVFVAALARANASARDCAVKYPRDRVYDALRDFRSLTRYRIQYDLAPHGFEFSGFADPISNFVDAVPPEAHFLKLAGLGDTP